MKKRGKFRKLAKISLFLLLISVGTLCSCVSVQNRAITPAQMETTEIIGRVEASFTTYHFLHIVSNKSIEKKAYDQLLAKAKEEYSGNIDVVNIKAEGSFNALSLIPYAGYIGFGNFQTIKATGDVIIRRAVTVNTGTSAPSSGIAEAASKLAASISDRLARNTSIAILNVHSTSMSTSESIIEELEYNFVNSGRLRVIDRRRLDQMRTELNIQLSGDISDSSAVSIGTRLGANVVITGEITGSSSSRMLVLRVIDVNTAQILAIEREPI